MDRLSRESAVGSGESGGGRRPAASAWRLAAMGSALLVTIASSEAPRLVAQTPAPIASHQQATPATGAGKATVDSVDAHRSLLKTYCVGCHNQRSKLAGVMFDSVDLADVPHDAVVWEKTIRKLRAGMMPPPGARRPEPQAAEAFASWLEQELDGAAVRDPDPGRVALHRLNRAEYANAIEELLGVRVDASALLPKDDEADGFDNVATALRVSPSFIDQYISAARLVSVKALGSPTAKTDSVTYRPMPGTDQSRRVDGLPPGTRGGLLVEHLFPADGEYKINVGGLAAAFYIRGIEYRQTLVVTIDGKKVFEQSLGGEEDMTAIELQQAPAVAAINKRFQGIPVNVTAGPHKIGVTFVAKGYAEADEVLQSFKPGSGEERIARVGSVEIFGPYNPSGVSDTPSRARLLVCRPDAAATPESEQTCATTILSTLARRAFRRPLEPQDLTGAMAFYREGRAAGGFETGIQYGMTAILSSPKFLFRAERVPESMAPGAVYRLSDVELASRLSFFLWGRTPDDALIDVAASGTLHEPAVLEKQVRRMLADPRLDARVTDFAFQWLRLRSLGDVDPDAGSFPNYDAGLREAFKRETELFVRSIVRDDRSVLDLLTADHTFLNERLALHYGIANVRGPAFRRVTLADPNRHGLLGKGAILMATSYGNRTSPVLRGAWVLESIIGTPPASPPPDVEAFKENKPGEKAKTIRGILEEHRENPSCNACHGVIDPLGFALENFDAIGAWRVKDRHAGEVLDTSGTLVDGTRIGGPVDLRDTLTRRPEQFARTFTEKLMTFALGRGVEAHDMPAVRTIVRDAAGEHYRFSSIVLGIVRSAPFSMRKSAAGTTDAEQQQIR